MKPFESTQVAQAFQAFPAAVREKLLALRELIFETAASTAGVGKLEEALKWGEPAYLTTASKSGSTVRIGWKARSPSRYALYFNCQTTLVDTFRTLFPSELKFEGNRAIVFAVSDVVPTDCLGLCIAAALTYHRDRAASAPRKPGATRAPRRP